MKSTFLFQVVKIVILLLLCCGVSGYAAHDIRPISPLTSSEELATRYQKAQQYYQHIQESPDSGNQSGTSIDRNDWLAGLRLFRKVYLTNPRSEFAPQSLYTMAEMHTAMYERFHLPLDRNRAEEYLEELIRLFPEHPLRKKALRTLPLLPTLHERDISTEVLPAYNNHLKDANPNSDLAPLTQPEIQKIQETPPPSLLSPLAAEGSMASNPAGQSEQSLSTLHTGYTGDEQAEKPPQIIYPLGEKIIAGTELAQIAPVKYWSSDEYSRIAIQASSPVNIDSGIVKKNKDQPRRLYIDLQHSNIPPENVQTVRIDDGLLKQVRMGQFTQTTVRVVLDLDSISTYKIFHLNDPFRILVDVHGEKSPLSPDSNRQIPETITPSATKQLAQAEDEEQIPVPTLHDNKKKVAQAEAGRLDSDDESTGPVLSLAQQLGLGVKKIVIDPGHGGKDKGASGHGLYEKNVVLHIAQKLAQVLRSQYDFEVSLTRESDIYIPLEERTAIANTQKADLFISLHLNAHPNASITGFETYYLSLATNAEAMRVAALENATSSHNISEMEDILTSLMQNAKIRESSSLAAVTHKKLMTGLKAKNYAVRNRGIKQAPFYVLLGAEMPAILLEMSFISNKQEAQRLKNHRFQNTLAHLLAQGIASYAQKPSVANSF